MYIGLVLQKIQGTNTLFAFLNYDYLENVVQTPENKVQSDLMFCRNDNTTIYPISDSNKNSKLKWGTVDELLFEKKIATEPVDPAISELFSNNDNLWNIEDPQRNYIPFPFVVYGIDDGFRTITTDDTDFEFNGTIETYGKVDEYDDRYCFTLNPSDNKEQSPNRFAMFAWKTRYIVTEDEVKSIQASSPDESKPDEKREGGNNSDENPLKLFDENSPDETPLKLSLEEEDAEANTESKTDAEEDDEIASIKLNLPTIYTITQNEHTDNKPTVVWGIRNSKQFTRL